MVSPATKSLIDLCLFFENLKSLSKAKDFLKIMLHMIHIRN